MLQGRIMKDDNYRKQCLLESLDDNLLKSMAKEVFDGVDKVDLKSMDFSKDKDRNYRCV